MEREHYARGVDLLENSTASSQNILSQACWNIRDIEFLTFGQSSWDNQVHSWEKEQPKAAFKSSSSAHWDIFSIKILESRQDHQNTDWSLDNYSRLENRGNFVRKNSEIQCRREPLWVNNKTPSISIDCLQTWAWLPFWVQQNQQYFVMFYCLISTIKNNISKRC